MISAEAWAGMWRAFADGWPNEVCMAVYTDETFEVLANVHEKPHESFRLSLLDTDRLTRAYAAGKLLAFLHSHPEGNAEPSDRDYQSQLGRERGKGQGWTYGIVAVRGANGIVTSVDYPEFFGDAVDRGELVGRPYLWGIRDCFHIVRDYYKAQGIYVPDVPRIRDRMIYPEGTWQRRFFSHWIGETGFVEVDRQQRQPGDAFTFAVESLEPDHCGIYLGEARYLHHAIDKASEIDQFRYEDEILSKFRARFWRLKDTVSL